MYNLYPGHISKQFYELLAQYYQADVDMDIICFLLGDGQ